MIKIEQRIWKANRIGGELKKEIYEIAPQTGEPFSDPRTVWAGSAAEHSSSGTQQARSQPPPWRGKKKYERGRNFRKQILMILLLTKTRLRETESISWMVWASIIK